MKLIHQINIQFYRSIKDSKIKGINELNIFSGKNDVGKSNILKALDLFFNKSETNFLEDFNKERLLAVRQESVKGKQFIKIQITFNNPGNYSTLPEKFIITKSWDRLGHLIGIPKDKVESIFGAFEQAKDSTSRNYGGTGLGLNISKQLVELQNGKIWVESEEGVGSTFYAELPLGMQNFYLN